ncbi:uncharacterized protein ZFTRAF1 isoform X3 [Equus quagga]|uniref:uncharacterized protein ZFTRAF1 isoform X3 n=1 Tax=Equus quagga TaxID=89248 RepID=UPI001EE2344C|nr:uncharacterized protein ZFTRAF1 isoform X3 [Equus quagga]
MHPGFLFPSSRTAAGLSFECTNGHLMCAGCFIHLLADARLKEEQATCPNCRCEISKSLCCRNLAVEKAVSELPSECGFCLRQFPRSLLERHQKEECQDRVTQCKYKRIGCPWHGPFHELTVHEAACAHPTKTGNELMEILDEMDQSHRREMQLYNSVFSLLSFEKIGYTGEALPTARSPLHATQLRGQESSRLWAVGTSRAGCWALDKLLAMEGSLWGRTQAGGQAGKGLGQDSRGTCMALTEAPPTCPSHPIPARPSPPPPASSVLTAWGCTALGQLGSNQKVGVSWGAQELGACPAEPGARRTLVTSGSTCGRSLQWPQAS